MIKNLSIKPFFTMESNMADSLLEETSKSSAQFFFFFGLDVVAGH